AEEWFGALLPAQTPEPVVEGLHRAIAAAAAAPELQEALARLEYKTAMMSPRDVAARIRAERDRWGPIVQESGFKAEDGRLRPPGRAGGGAATRRAAWHRTARSS
ncbi:MAG: hypothetical protein ICV73_06100, partial [Acetobacteraceae bacterium]|nr:hypothetical protein [Acetobacteraceae bacterium]